MAQIEPRHLVGSWRRFGPIGPAYQVIAIGDAIADGADRIVKIRLAETGEQIEYTLNRVIDDEVLADGASSNGASSNGASPDGARYVRDSL